jgi:flagellar basal-body rod modification protein FlgD
METTAVAPTGTTSTPPATSTNGRALTSDFNTFLRMLTVQMQNQDPLNPIDSADYAVQLATFSGVEQQVRTNELLGALSAQLQLSGLSEMAGWVGKEARAAMSARFDGAPITLSPNPAAEADSAQLVVKDAQGREIARGPVPVSAEPIEWAGVGSNGTPLPNGTYSFELVSMKSGEVLRTDPVELYGVVREVRAEGGEVVLVMEGGATVPASRVTALRDQVQVSSSDELAGG